MAEVTKEPENPIIVALDGMEPADAVNMAEKLSPHVWGFKGNDLLDTRNGLAVMKSISDTGTGVFADTKYHDIPNTVMNRIGNLCGEFLPNLLTVHASGGIPMMQAAFSASGWRIKVLAVTVLTSLGEEQCNLTFGAPVKAKVLRFARNAVLAEMDGIVCSAKELEFLAGFYELENQTDLIKVCPGIRPLWFQELGDQKRVMTPAEAIRLGADYLVMGRPILMADDPVGAAKRTMEEIQAARAAG